MVPLYWPWLYKVKSSSETELGTCSRTPTELSSLLFSDSRRKQPKTFAFDHCFYSLNPEDDSFASQETVFDCVGRDILDNAFQGYNACIFAYGQTGKPAQPLRQENRDSASTFLFCRLGQVVYDDGLAGEQRHHTATL